VDWKNNLTHNYGIYLVGMRKHRAEILPWNRGADKDTAARVSVSNGGFPTTYIKQTNKLNNYLTN